MNDAGADRGHHDGLPGRAGTERIWTSALGYGVAVDQPGDWMVPQDPSVTGPSIGFQVVPETKVVKNRVHLDLVPTAGELESEFRQLENRGTTGALRRERA